MTRYNPLKYSSIVVFIILKIRSVLAGEYRVLFDEEQTKVMAVANAKVDGWSIYASTVTDFGNSFNSGPSEVIIRQNGVVSASTHQQISIYLQQLVLAMAFGLKQQFLALVTAVD